MKEEEQKIMGCAMGAQRMPGCGFLQSVHQNALACEPQTASLAAEGGVPIQRSSDGVDAEESFADILAEKRAIVGNKTVERLCPAHEVQRVNHPATTEYAAGLPAHFGAARLQSKKGFRGCRKPDPNPVNPEKPRQSCQK